MERLIDGQPGPHECWEELANASLDHDDLFPAENGCPVLDPCRQWALSLPTTVRPTN